MIEQWRQQYNRVRPYAALGYRPQPGGLYPTLDPGSKASKGHVICLTSLGTKSRPGHNFGQVLVDPRQRHRQIAA